MYIVNSCNLTFDVIIYELCLVINNVSISHWVNCNMNWIKFWDTEVNWEIAKNILVVDWEWCDDFIGSGFNIFKRTIFQFTASTLPNFL